MASRRKRTARPGDLQTLPSALHVTLQNLPAVLRTLLAALQAIWQTFPMILSLVVAPFRGRYSR
jgi:hypothetical protein